MLKYSLFHTWVLEEKGTLNFKVGLTNHIISNLGKINYIGLPEIGEDVVKGAILFILETSKSAIEAYSPISGTVLKINTILEDSVDLLNQDPEGLGWICLMSSTESDIRNAKLLSYKEYYEL